VVACIYSRYLDKLDMKKVVPFGQLTDYDDKGVAEKDDGLKKSFKDNEEVDDIAAVTRFLSKGDGTDYGQMPDTLTPAALALRMNKYALKWRVYEEQVQAATHKKSPQQAAMLPRLSDTLTRLEADKVAAVEAEEYQIAAELKGKAKAVRFELEALS